MSDSQRYPLNHYLINDVKDIVVLHIFLHIVSQAEMCKSLYKETTIKNNQFSNRKVFIYYAFLIRKRVL